MIEFPRYPLLQDDEVWDLSMRILARDVVVDGVLKQLKSHKDIFLEVARSLREQHAKYKNKNYRTPDGAGLLNPLYLDHYATSMYCFSRALFLAGVDRLILDQIFFSIKCRASIDLYYEFEIPAYFYPLHAYATVLGRARYNKYFVIRQNCTVGNNHGYYPRFGEGVIMRAHSMVLGNCQIGNNVQIAAGAIVIDTDIPDNSIVFGTPKNQVIKKNNIDNIAYFFPH